MSSACCGSWRRSRCEIWESHELEHAFAQHVLLEVIDQRVLHFGHRLMDETGQTALAAIVVLRASVAERPIGSAT